MATFIVKRFFQFIPVLLGISILVFFLLHLIPGDPALTLLGQDATKEDLERLRNVLGLNEPLYIQLMVFLKNLFQGDLGISIFQDTPVITLISTHLPATMELAVVAMIIALLIAIPLGIISAVKQFSWLDYGSMFFAQIGVSMPVFWMGLLLIIGFSVNLNILPSFGRGEPLLDAFVQTIQTGNLFYLVDSLQHIILPAFTLGVMSAALITRMVRSAMLEVLKEDYIRTAEAKGVRGIVVIMKHAFRNALIPVVTIVGLQFGNLLGGAIVTETVFAWPGIGRLVITAISQRDFPVVQGCVLMIALIFALINLIVDILYAIINPKIQQG
ncbi:ABC transporter permease [Cytobacillus oceanisediminis]|uniref:ABC transporter permease n=1 Tax=Cytobacillus TaxID=2675230 RepID=UPI0018CFC0D4|nr:MULTISPECIES: ABC transporter permease [Cytobacillus]MBG9445290.1 peptide ABC transporter permease [Cytobacillus firmus]MBY6052115.1 ABC transporter permease [Cytobacillus firmus]MCC3648511.1 ABC transporter permease [Cytobacillus oceanisediminis]